MGTTQTATELQQMPSVAVPVPADCNDRPDAPTRSPSTADSFQPLAPSVPTGEPAARVFQAVQPITTTHVSYTSRVLITMLIVVANTIQVRKKTQQS